MVFDLVAEITQRCTVPRKTGQRGFSYWGGATIIVDPDGEVRYSILKRVVGDKRRERRLEFLEERVRRISGRLKTSRGSVAQPMLYPYPQDARLGAARTLRLEVRQGAGDWAPLEFDEMPPRGVRWHLPAVGSGTMTVRTVYRQAMRTTYVRYIVTTTQYWGAPLRRASFEVRLPQGAKNPTFSYPFRPKGPSVRVWTYEAE